MKTAPPVLAQPCLNNAAFISIKYQQHTGSHYFMWREMKWWFCSTHLPFFFHGLPSHHSSSLTFLLLPLPVPQRKLVHTPGVSDRCKALTAVLFVARSKPGRSHQRLPGHNDHSSAKYRLSSQRSVTLERCLILSFFCLLLCLNFWSPSALKSAIIPQHLISLVENGAAVINLSSR